MNKIEESEQDAPTPAVTTVDDYLQAVIDAQREHRITWAEAATRVLMAERPDVAERVWQGNQAEIHHYAERDPWVFFSAIVGCWERR